MTALTPSSAYALRAGSTCEVQDQFTFSPTTPSDEKSTYLDQVVVSVLVRDPQLLAMGLLKLGDSLDARGPEHVQLDAVLLLNLGGEIERLLEVVERVDKDEGDDVLLDPPPSTDFRQHVERSETCKSEGRRLVEGGEVVDGPSEDLLRGRVGEKEVGGGEGGGVEGGGAGRRTRCDGRSGHLRRGFGGDGLGEMRERCNPSVLL